MQGFRPFGHGGPYPMPSNLSPLAPPFTVGPYFGSRIGTNSLAGDPFYGEQYYDPTCVTQHGTVPWPRPSSPACLSDPFPTGVNTGTSSIHPGVGPSFNHFMSTFDNFMSTFPGPESYNRHVNPQVTSSRVVPDRNTSLNASERGDVLPAPTAPSDAFWNANAKSGMGQSKAGAPSYASFANQGVSAVDNMQASAEPSNVWAGKSAVSIAETSSVEPQNTDLLLGRLSSKFEENSKNVPIDISKTSVLYPTSRPEKPSNEKPYEKSSPDFSSEPWNHTDPRLYNADPKYGSHNIDPLGFYPVFSFSSNYQTYEPPSINNPLTHTNGSLFNFDPIMRPMDTCDAKVPSACYISSGTGYIHANAEMSEVYSDASSSNNGVEESDRARVDPSMLDASEILEQFNPGVDSPCWKGASDSQYSLFGAAEAGLPHTPAEISGFNNLNLQGYHNHPPKSDNVVEVSSSQGSGKCIGKDSSASFLKQTSPIVCSLPGSTGGGSHLEPSQTVKSSVVSRQPNYEDRNADIGLDSKHATLFGSTLPSLRSNVPIFDLNIPKLHDGPLDNFTGSKFSKSQALVNSMLVMSEMLLSYCTEDFGALKEQDHAVIQQVVQNLDGCVFLTGSTSSVPKTKFIPSETANSSEKQSNGHKGTEVAQCRASNTEEKGGQNACEEKKNSSMFSTKDSSALRTIPATDQELEQEDMTKGIQKILEENFHDDDEPDSQGLLYKNLWLEAEAALCSLKYKERFARMKIGMQKSQNPTEKGKEPVDLDKLSSNKATLEPKNDGLFESSSDEREESEESDETGDSEETEDSNDSINGEVPEALEENLDQSTTTVDDNASVMARFRILKSRIERTSSMNKEDNTSSMNKEDEPHDLIDARFHPGSKGSLHNVSMQIAEDNAVKQQSIANELSFSGREKGWPFIKSQFTPHVTEQVELEFGPMQSAPKAHIVTDRFVTGECSNRAESGATQSAAATNIMVDKFSTRECSSPSSEWEHVLKDAEWPA